MSTDPNALSAPHQTLCHLFVTRDTLSDDSQPPVNDTQLVHSQTDAEVLSTIEAILSTQDNLDLQQRLIKILIDKDKKVEEVQTLLNQAEDQMLLKNEQMLKLHDQTNALAARNHHLEYDAKADKDKITILRDRIAELTSIIEGMRMTV